MDNRKFPIPYTRWALNPIAYKRVSVFKNRNFCPGIKGPRIDLPAYPAQQTQGLEKRPFMDRNYNFMYKTQQQTGITERTIMGRKFYSAHDLYMNINPAQRSQRKTASFFNTILCVFTVNIYIFKQNFNPSMLLHPNPASVESAKDLPVAAGARRQGYRRAMIKPLSRPQIR